MSDPRREKYLIEEIARLQESKLTALRNSRELHGAEKAAVLDHYNEMFETQRRLESELEELENA